ncbi:glycoside hydrolase family 97 catalytic domain-containing protein [Occultella gossypii]|uniref:Glycoside hydrolase family 97 catalytic domain-containing protein n=1 Tax=Occultella gossypii TaxID=2800820 RepID=A0ABS7S6E0_9MICO|nr:glycoside hydrolase family 97 catalytic domain-containing protein [Occultella gossypii]MBZ2195433.1 glycoside hydrolase family 97 catalytic domain-containing protein [Occultella gossypii]
MPESTWSASLDECGIEASLRDGGIHVALWRGALRLESATALRLPTAGGTDLLAGLRPASAVEREVTESYELAVGKRTGRHDVRHAEHQVTFAREGGAQVTLVLRAAADGVAFRLILDGFAGEVVQGSDLALGLPADAPLWPLRYTPWYEEPRFESTTADLPDGSWGLPLLAQAVPGDDAGYVLIAESDIDGGYGGSLLTHEAGAFSFTLADPVQLGEGNTAIPWRVFHLGSLATIVASHLVDDLARPAVAPIPAWVRPGRAAWSWWSDFYSGAQLSAQLRLVDYAAEHGWEHLLVDCGWDRTWMPELVAAAGARGIGVFVWVSWDWLDIHTDLAEWASWGVAGVKVDFMESESQERYRWYDEVIAEAARVGLMLNFHGSVIPRGWARTHPHVVTYEAVRGAEYYVFYGDPLPPAHNTIVPFTRNVIGSADYTPVTFSTPARVTSDAHELALAIVIESGITHFADEIGEYLARPIAQEVLDAVPATWDETRLIGGRPGDWVAIARRTGDDWFVGVIGAGQPRTVDLDLTGLGDQPFHLVTDDGDTGLRKAPQQLKAGHLRLDLRDNGGAVLFPTNLRRRALNLDTAATVERDLIAAHPGDVVEIAATGPSDTELVPPPGWPEPRSTGRQRWAVTVPQDVGPAYVAVLTLRDSDRSRRPLAHVRIVTHPGHGTTDLVPCRPITAANGYGPVERDMSNGPGNPNDGAPMSVAGTTYERGLGVCSPAEVTYAIGGLASEFTCLVGIDDETPGQVATVEVRGDDVVLARLELRSGEPAHEVRVAVEGRVRLSLLVDDPSGAAPDARPHIDWISPQLHR